MNLDNYQELKKAGFDDSKIQDYLRPQLSAAGFDETRINQYFQNQSGARSLSLAGYEQNETIKQMGKAISEVQNKAASEGKNLGFGDAIKLGWEQSVSGMLSKGKLPRELTAEEEKSLNFFERAVMGAASVLADTPVYFVGGKVGAAAGAGVGAVAGAPFAGVGAAPGAAIGATVGGASGAFAFHAAARQMLVNMYKEGGVADFGELMDRVATEAGKGAIIGGATLGAGRAAQFGVKTLKGGAFLSTLAGKTTLATGLETTAKGLPFGAEVLGLTGASSLVEGQVPSAQDFADNAILLLTLKGFNKTTQTGINKLNKVVIDNLYNKFVKEGTSPKTAVQEAMHDPVKLQNILTEQQQIKKGYTEVKENPLKGTREGKEDILATLKPDDLRTYIIQRGAAIKDPKTGDIIVQGGDLSKETGSYDNFGFSKMIFKHGITIDQALMLPSIIREYKPITDTRLGYERRRVPYNDKYNLVVSFAPLGDGIRKEITVFKEPVRKNKSLEMSQKEEVAILDTAFGDRNQDTNQAGFAPNVHGKTATLDSATSINSISNEGGIFKGVTRIPISENKEASTIPNEEITRKSNIINDLQKAVDVPIRMGKVRGRKSVIGQYYPHAEMIRTRKANDIATVSHEIGHHLEKNLFGRVGSKEITSFYDELSPIATKAKTRSKNAVAAEGFAEFIAKYVANPEEAKKVAPKFYDFFEKEIRAKDPQMQAALLDAREQTRKWAEQPAFMRVLSAISKEDNINKDLSTAEKLQALKNKIAYRFFDDKAPIRKIVEELEEKTGQKIEWQNNPYIMARMFAGWVGKAEYFTQKATYDFKTSKDTGKSLKQILEPIKNLDEFSVYLVSKRAVELAARQIESGIRVEDAKQNIKDLDGKYKNTAEELYNYQNELLKMQLDGGLISLDTFNKIKEANKNRVPFYRVMEKTQNYALGSKSLASKQTIKKIKGSTRDIIDPIESIIKDTYDTINAVERNRVGLAIADLSKLDKSGEFVFEVPKSKVKVGQSEEGEIWRVKETFDKNNEIKVFRNGEVEIYEVDPEVAKIINGLNPNEAKAFAKSLGFFARTLRAGATGFNTTFAIKNLLRDTVFAYLTTTSGFNPFTSVLGNVKMAITRDEAYWEWKKAGGSQSTFVSLDRNALQKGIRDLTETGYLKRVWNRVSEKKFAEAVDIGILDPLRFVSETSELITRLGEFKSSMKAKEFTKENLEKAGFNSREITLDFAKGGVTSKYINTMAAFFNANVLGLEKTVEIVKKKPIKAVALLGTLGILNALANYDWKKGQEDEDIAEVLKAQKNTNYVFKIGDVIYRLPKPQQIGFISTFFSEMTTLALDKMNGNERDEVARNLAQAFWNEFTLNPIPTAFSVPIENWANRSLFFDRPIVPAYAEEASPEYQYTEGTHEISKAISRALGGFIGRKNTFSPAKMENIVRGYTGGVGNYLTEVIDFAARKAGIVPDPIKPADRLTDVVFVRAFTIRHPSAGAESINKFYDEYKTRKAYIKDFEIAGKEFDFETQTDLAKYQIYKGLVPTVDSLSKLSAQIRIINNMPDMSADEKRQNIDKLYLLRIQTAKQGLILIKQMDEQVENMNEGISFR